LTGFQEGTKLQTEEPMVIVGDLLGVLMAESTERWLGPGPGGRRLAYLSAFWLGVGLLGGTADFLARISGPDAIGWGQAILPPVLMSLLWIPASLAILSASRAFPPIRLHPSFRIDTLRAVLHGAGSLGVGFVLNGLFFAILTAAGVSPPGEYWSLTRETALRFLHLNAGVYWAVVGLAHLPGVLTSRSAALRALAGQEAFQKTLTVRSGNQTIVVRVSDIRWIEGAGDYVRLHLGMANHLHSERLKRLESRLDPHRFVRVHRSAIVNVEAVRKLRHLGHGDYEAVLEDGSVVRVSRTRRSQLTEVLEKSQAGENE
jgi:hypothetical protein